MSLSIESITGWKFQCFKYGKLFNICSVIETTNCWRESILNLCFLFEWLQLFNGKLSWLKYQKEGNILGWPEEIPGILENFQFSSFFAFLITNFSKFWNCTNSMQMASLGNFQFYIFNRNFPSFESVRLIARRREKRKIWR